MPERSAAEIRSEIGAERQRLADDFVALRAEARSLLPAVLAVVAGIGLVSKRRVLRTGGRLLQKLR